MPRPRHFKDVARLARVALSRGATIETPGVVLWRASGGCTDPFTFTLEGRMPAWGHDVFAGHARPNFETRADGMDAGNTLWLDIEAPCRKCEQCLKRRAAGWARRARAEIACAKRTWFATLTLAPEDHFRMECQAWDACKQRGVRFASLTEDEKFLERHRAISREITLFLKRVRKESAAELRYVFVVEAHKSGLPHYHALIHEAGLTRVTERTLRKQWKLGHSKFKLVTEDDKYARYVSKYLAKTSLARVRASVKYGIPLMG